MVGETQQRPAAKATQVRTGQAPEAFPDVEGYVITRRLGEGAMGLVYMAHTDDELRKPVAIKTILVAYARDEYFRAKFITEGRQHSELHHPHILEIHRAGELDDCPFLVMQFVRDGSLRDRLEKGPLPPREAADIMFKLTDALRHAHEDLEEPLIHMDIKPENILIDGNNPYLSDFGIARKIHMGDVAPGSVVQGTPGYWSPEQQRNYPSIKSDIYSLGVVFYEMLKGDIPEPRLQVIHSPKDNDTLTRSLPKEAQKFGPLIARCLQIDPDDRPTAVELLEELKTVSRTRAPIRRRGAQPRSRGARAARGDRAARGRDPGRGSDRAPAARRRRPAAHRSDYLTRLMM